MENTVYVQKLTTGTVFKLVAVGSFCTFVPLFIGFGICALFGSSALEWNERPLTGIPGLIGAPLMGLFFAILFTGFAGSVVAGGLWLFSKLNGMTISYRTF